MQSRRRLKSSPLFVLTGKAACAACIALFFFFFFLSSPFLSGEGFWLPVSFSRCCHHRGFTFVSPLLLFPQWHSDCCVLPSLFPPLSFSSSSSRSSRHCHSCPAPYHLPQLKWAGSITTETCGDCFRRETRGEGRRRSRVLLRTSPPLLRLQAYFLVRIFLLFLLFPCFSFLFSFWWAGHRSGRKQDCLCRWKEGKEGSWCRTPAFRNARSGLRMVSPATPSFACFIPPSVPANSISPPHPASNPHHLSPAAPPYLARSSSVLWSRRWFEWRLYRHGANGRSAGK